MQVATQHAEAIRQRSGMNVEEGLLLNWVALHSANVAPRNIQLSALVEADFANPCLTLRDGTTMSAGKTAQPVALDRFVQFAFADIFIQDFAEG